MKKVVVGMSGGIDSSVAALLLKQQGYEVIGVTLKHLDSNEEGTCCSLDDIYDAKTVCYNLGIPHFVYDVKDEFKKEVIEYFIDGYNRGITPSPCVICDEKIKIQKLYEIAKKLGAEHIATGHYSNVEYVKEYNRYLLKKSKNDKKDQTYMLYRINEDILKIMLFPLSDYTKDRVREIAKKNQIKIYQKPDSQGICFAKDGYIKFLKENLTDVNEGNFVDKEGNVLGKHKGYQFYTIGQRRGLNLKLPHAYFIIDIISEKNEILLGEFKDLLLKEIEIINYKFCVNIDELLGKKLVFKPRFSSDGVKGELYKKGSRVFIKYDEKNAQNSKGQHIVIYDNNYVIGGGEIKFI
ncbi:tRNA-specific 2-thiouridylase [Hypnocyclicus thermotrophus]|uniref:tRNA-specific 2-thiouridylase MnmA n=1 Tax=Hypnocyclicus thermotrophus TaxID=1627895 RepID=A0AA46DYR7_9FUSO|nr:tRNA 2-thiouridine(34) synthase MnmA [Hypnocyclicus thermotrophus]TDT70548.1 tRNA-specific 2-thiouridylase [Hypnocyclicus thermotrophus]